MGNLRRCNHACSCVSSIYWSTGICRSTYAAYNQTVMTPNLSSCEERLIDSLEWGMITMDPQIADELLTKTLAQWHQVDKKVLGQQLVERLHLVKCSPPYESYTAQI